MIHLMIVGAQKAGTTSLHNYLKSHPRIVGHQSKEFSFFADESEYSKGFDWAFSRYFESKQHDLVVAKNVTLSVHEEGMVRLKKHNPDAKIVFIMREPVNRAYSSFSMGVKDGWMTRSFDDIIKPLKAEDDRDVMFQFFVQHGAYAQQIQTMLRYFPKQNIKLYLFEDLKENPQDVCDDIYSWLGIQSSTIEQKKFNVTAQPRSKALANITNRLRKNHNPYKKLLKAILPYSMFINLTNRFVKLNDSKKAFEPMSDQTRMALNEYFKPRNQALLDLIKNEHLDLKIFSSESKYWLQS